MWRSVSAVPQQPAMAATCNPNYSLFHQMRHGALRLSPVKIGSATCSRVRVEAVLMQRAGCEYACAAATTYTACSILTPHQ